MDLKYNTKEYSRMERELQSFPIDVEPIDSVFFIFAVKAKTNDGEIRRMLEKNKLYYLLKGFEVQEDKVIVDSNRYNRPIYDFFMETYSSSVPHVSVSAIVGENGAGKSSLIEFEIRLINNLATVVFGEYSKEPGWEHLHYINNTSGELFYLYNNLLYKLTVTDRRVELKVYKNPIEQENGNRIFYMRADSEEILLNECNDNNIPFVGIREERKDDFKNVLSQFFYTIVLNQSVYAYNTHDYKKECNNEEYEVKVRKCYNTDKKRYYSTAEKCWLNGLFHKNDGYQIPIVLSPYRFEGNFNINRENELAYERLISLLVHYKEFRHINEHLLVTNFVLKKKEHSYDLHYIHKKLGYKQFDNKSYVLMKKIIRETWISKLQLKNITLRKNGYTSLAMNYLVYKTLKIASTYEEYDNFREKYLVKKKPFEESEFRELVSRTINNRSHVTNKLYRTFAFLIWNIYDIKKGQSQIKVDDIAKRWIKEQPNKKLNEQLGTINLVLQAFIPPPFFELNIELEELKTHDIVSFEALSSGEKQQTYIISSLLYHLSNIDSVMNDRCTNERIVYNNVHLVLEEIELYFHPQLQKEFIKNLLNSMRQMSFLSIKWIDICIVTHSPFVLSDIPSENVLTLSKGYHDSDRFDCFGANIHEMLRTAFFLEKGTIGDFASWLIKRIAQCLRTHRWINNLEEPPEFFSLLKEGTPKEFEFLKEFKNLLENNNFNKKAFNEVYGKDNLLRLINMIEEPVIKRVLLDDYHKTFPEDKEGYKNSLIKMIQNLQHQIEEFND